MKKTMFLTSFLTLVSLPSFAQNQLMCRHHLFELLGLDSHRPQVSVTKKLVGVVNEVNVKRFNSRLVKGGPCELSISIYQPSGPVAGITVQDSHYIFNPFNHNVGAQDTQESCDNMNPNLVRGSNSFRQSTGWREKYKTNTSLQKNSDGTFTLTYQTSDSGSKQAITCTGVIQ